MLADPLPFPPQHPPHTPPPQHSNDRVWKEYCSGQTRGLISGPDRLCKVPGIHRWQPKFLRHHWSRVRQHPVIALPPLADAQAAAQQRRHGRRGGRGAQSARAAPPPANSGRWGDPPGPCPRARPSAALPTDRRPGESPASTRRTLPVEPSACGACQHRPPLGREHPGDGGGRPRTFTRAALQRPLLGPRAPAAPRLSACTPVASPRTLTITSEATAVPLNGMCTVAVCPPRPMTTELSYQGPAVKGSPRRSLTRSWPSAASKTRLNRAVPAVTDHHTGSPRAWQGQEAWPCGDGGRPRPAHSDRPPPPHCILLLTGSMPE